MNIYTFNFIDFLRLLIVYYVVSYSKYCKPNILAKFGIIFVSNNILEFESKMQNSE